MGEHWIDRQIREAQERGEFDNLPGAGKPLGNLRQTDENWWIKAKLEREGLSMPLPSGMQLRKEVAEIDETVADIRDEQVVRDLVTDLNRRVREHHRRGAPMPGQIVRVLDADAVVERWRDRRS